MQSKDTLYIAFASIQKSVVTGKIQLRDRFAQSDDGVFLILGTFNDNRNAYCFGVNPLGTQADFRVMDDGRTLDYNWDTEWLSKSSVFDWGWFTEIAIPFKSIKFKKGLKNWQINFRRIIREDSEISYWSGRYLNLIINNLGKPAVIKSEYLCFEMDWSIQSKS